MLFNTTDSLSRAPLVGTDATSAAVMGEEGSVLVIPRRGMALPMGELVKALVATMRERRRAMVLFIFEIVFLCCVMDVCTVIFTAAIFFYDWNVGRQKIQIFE
jgi:hypothetical protein